MNLLVDARPLSDPAQGGVSRVAKALVVNYARQFSEDSLVCLTTGTRQPQLPEELSTLRNVSHLHLSLPNKIWSTACLLRLASLTNTVQKKVGHIDHTFLPNIGFIGNMTGNPYSLVLHDLSYFIEPKWFTPRSRLWHRAVRARDLIVDATHLFAVSETTKRDAVRLLSIPEQRITVLPIGSTLDAVGAHGMRPDRPDIGGRIPRAPTGKRFVLALGACDPRKNAGTAIEAVRQLREDPNFHDIELVLIGGAPRDQRNTEPWIHFPARPSDEELAFFYKTTSVLLYPSWYEGYGLPLHEATQYGTPCVASTSGALPETAPPNTIFANPAKPHHWAEALRLALNQARIVPPKTRQTWQSAVHDLHKVFIDNSHGSR